MSDWDRRRHHSGRVAHFAGIGGHVTFTGRLNIVLIVAAGYRNASVAPLREKAN